MQFPDIPLDAVNKAASLLFSRKDTVTEDEATGLKDNLLEKIQELDRAIASINGQLDSRKDDPEWEQSARRALRGYNRQRDSLKTFLATVNTTINALHAHNARVSSHRERVERLTVANGDAQLWLTEFKKVCKTALGMDRYMELVNETKRRLALRSEQPATLNSESSVINEPAQKS